MRRALLLMLFAVLAFAAHAQQNTFTNPLLPHGADPWVLEHKGKYYVMHTTGPKLALYVTEDVTDLKNARREVIFHADSIGMKNVWAPEIHFVDGKWYIYFAATKGSEWPIHQTYVLENASRDPLQGKFVMKGRVSTDPDDNWSIDASVFKHKGKLYMIWSGWQNPRVDKETQCIYIARMANPWTLGSERVVISRPELDWERHNRNPDGGGPKHEVFVNEGPEYLKSPDGKLIHVVYSASGCWTPWYSLGMLTASADADLLDPASWSKAQQPVFTQSPENGVYGPGHNGFFRSPDGKESYIIYHARNSASFKDARSPRVQQFQWGKDGYPRFGVPQPVSAELKKPSGTKSAK